MEILDFLKELFVMIDVASVVAVMVLVWLWGELGATGKVQLLSSFGTGIVIGVIQQYAAGAVFGLAGWFQAIIYGIILGGLASGAYEAIKGAVVKGIGVEKAEVAEEKYYSEREGVG